MTCLAGSTASLSTSDSQMVSLALNQLGASSLMTSAGSSVMGGSTALSGGGQEDQGQESLGDATIQGLINATQSFTVPILPPDMPALTTTTCHSLETTTSVTATAARVITPTGTYTTTTPRATTVGAPNSTSQLSSVVSQAGETIVMGPGLSNTLRLEHEMPTATQAVLDTVATSLMTAGGEHY